MTRLTKSELFHEILCFRDEVKRDHEARRKGITVSYQPSCPFHGESLTAVSENKAKKNQKR